MIRKNKMSYSQKDMSSTCVASNYMCEHRKLMKVHAARLLTGEMERMVMQASCRSLQEVSKTKITPSQWLVSITLLDLNVQRVLYNDYY